MAEMVEKFDIKDVNPNPARFDLKKAEAINTSQMRLLPLDDVTHRALPFLKEAGVVSDPVNDADAQMLELAMPLVAERINKLTEAAPMLGFLCVGTVVGGFLLYGMVVNPIVAQPIGKHINYESPHFYIAAVMLGYLAATTVSQMLSRHRWVRWFGVLALASAIVAYMAYAQWFISVWCFLAALLSGVIYLHVCSRPDSSTGLGLLP